MIRYKRRNKISNKILIVDSENLGLVYSLLSEILDADFQRVRRGWQLVSAHCLLTEGPWDRAWDNLSSGAVHSTQDHRK